MDAKNVRSRFYDLKLGPTTRTYLFSFSFCLQVGKAREFWELWELYLPQSGVDWGAAARQAAKTVGLLMVVVFGSCMDIAAIQADVPEKLSFDNELQTVGGWWLFFLSSFLPSYIRFLMLPAALAAVCCDMI
jgi:hypothetical protein